MKRLVTYNLFEELKSSTYLSAATKLGNLGHSRRSKVLTDYYTLKKAEEERLKVKEVYDDLSKWGHFELEVCEVKWNRTTSSSEFSDPILVGNFFMASRFDDFIGDLISDWYFEDGKDGLIIPFDIGIMPSDSETLEKMQSNNLDKEMWWGVWFPLRMWIKAHEKNSAGVIVDKDPYIESYENHQVFFTKRSEAVRFKNLLISGILGQNDFSAYKWSKGLRKDLLEIVKKEEEYNKTRIEKGIKTHDLGPVIEEGDLQKIASSIRNLSVNKIWRS